MLYSGCTTSSRRSCFWLAVLLSRPRNTWASRYLASLMGSWHISNFIWPLLGKPPSSRLPLQAVLHVSCSASSLSSFLYFGGGPIYSAPKNPYFFTKISSSQQHKMIMIASIDWVSNIQSSPLIGYHSINKKFFDFVEYCYHTNWGKEEETVVHWINIWGSTSIEYYGSTSGSSSRSTRRLWNTFTFRKFYIFGACQLKVSTIHHLRALSNCNMELGSSQMRE